MKTVNRFSLDRNLLGPLAWIGAEGDGKESQSILAVVHESFVQVSTVAM